MSDTIFNFFGLRENPFRINPDPRFLFVTERTRATSDELAYAIRTRKGLILLTGEVGTGKTMLIRRLLDWLTEQNMPTAFIFNSRIQSEHLIDFILNDFGVRCASPVKSEKLLALNTWLLERFRAGQTPVLIVDEAQGLEPATLEEIRLLLNFETPREKLLQIVLAGQPELEVKLKRHDLRQLRQRITVRCRTLPLTLEQTCGYIVERLRVAGANGNPLFEPAALASVHAYSHGIPRVINVLCEHSLINACADGVSTISPQIVEQAARDCQLDRADSIARIVNTGSYPATGLSDIESILAAIASGPDSATEPAPQHQFSEAFPTMGDRSAPQVRTSPATQEARYPRITEDLPARNSVAADLTVSTATPAPQFQSSLPPSEPVPRTEIDVPDLEAPPLSPHPRRPSSANFLGHWVRSFAADARACSRQFRRAIYSFEARVWKPLVRSVRHELHQLSVRSVQLVRDSRWQGFWTKAESTLRLRWHNLKSATSRSVNQYSGRNERVGQERDPAASSRVSRRRAILSLRRWLHEPLTSQRKVRAHHRHS